MGVQEGLVRLVSGLAIAGVSALAVGAVTSVSTQATTAAQRARNPGSLAGDPALCYRIGYKVLCIASGEVPEERAEPTAADERQAPVVPPVRRWVPVS